MSIVDFSVGVDLPHFDLQLPELGGRWFCPEVYRDSHLAWAK